MNLELTVTAIKQLQKLPKKEANKVIRKLELLQESPYSGKKLTGKLSDRYSLKAWPYRILYIIDNKEEKVIIDVIEHRQGVYK